MNINSNQNYMRASDECTIVKKKKSKLCYYGNKTKAPCLPNK